MAGGAREGGMTFIATLSPLHGTFSLYTHHFMFMFIIIIIIIISSSITNPNNSTDTYQLWILLCELFAINLIFHASISVLRFRPSDSKVKLEFVEKGKASVT